MQPDIPSANTQSGVVILLASYQGGRFIDAQLQSIAGQTYADWQLIVSDDGSQDATRDKVLRFAATHPAGKVTLIDGPKQGATQNFLSLIDHAPAGRALAFADQDDFWFPEKLANAMQKLSQVRGAAHYAARTIIADEALSPIIETRIFPRPMTFRNALVQACMAGNTSVFNPAAASLLKQGVASARAADIQSHDWWAYQLTSGAGAMIVHDTRPALLYRQHHRAEMGRNDTAGAMLKRVGMLFSGDYGGWLKSNLRALMPVRHLLTVDNRAVLDRFEKALANRGPQAALQMRQAGLYRQTTVGTAALYAAASLGRLQ